MPDINVCIIDWQRLSSYEYLIAAERNTPAVGEYIAKLFKKWNLNLASVNFVAHSMGAHVAGIAGKRLKGMIGKIFGKSQSTHFQSSSGNLFPGKVPEFLVPG